MIKLDGTDNKGKLGANSILAVSMAICKVGLLGGGAATQSVRVGGWVGGQRRKRCTEQEWAVHVVFVGAGAVHVHSC
jgi:enolase